MPGNIFSFETLNSTLPIPSMKSTVSFLSIVIFVIDRPNETVYLCELNLMDTLLLVKKSLPSKNIS